MKPSEIVKNERDFRNNRMQSYLINGKVIKTNYYAYNYPYWDGNGGDYKRIPFRVSSETVFNELVEKGYNYIRFVETTTCIRGFHNMHYRAEKR